MRKLLYILLFISSVASGQTYGNAQYQRMISALNSAGVPATGKDAVALFHFSVKAYLTGKAGWFDTSGNYAVGTYANVAATANAIYPAIGRTTTSLAFNLVSVGTATTSPNYYLTFVGSPTPGEGQMPWNGTSQYANTGIALSVFNSATSISMSYYSYTNNAAAARVEMGGYNSSPFMLLYTRFTGNTYYGYLKDAANANVTITSSEGYRLITRVASDSVFLFHNGALVGRKLATLVATTFGTGNIFIGGALGTIGGAPLTFTNRTWGGGHVGTGLNITAESQSMSQLYMEKRYRMQ